MSSVTVFHSVMAGLPQDYIPIAMDMARLLQRGVLSRAQKAYWLLAGTMNFVMNYSTWLPKLSPPWQFFSDPTINLCCTAKNGCIKPAVDTEDRGGVSIKSLCEKGTGDEYRFLKVKKIYLPHVG
jgi:hypothetical protein